MNPVAKIMVVDDEPNVRLVVRRVLEKVGHEVIEADGGEECLKKLSKAPVDLVFMDIRMPGDNGWTVYRKIKEDEKMQDIPVVMLTIKPLTQETLKRKEMEGLADYITKPFSGEDLVEVVKQFSD